MPGFHNAMNRMTLRQRSVRHGFVRFFKGIGMIRSVLLGLLCAMVPMQVAAQPIVASILSTGDGDTLRINQNGQTVIIRLACIDSPEPDQPGGTAAAQRLAQLLPRGQSIQLIPVDTDTHGRTVGVVFANGRSVNMQMVQEGHAAAYRYHLSSCPNSRNDLLAAESSARAARRGFWAQANPIMPWDWRRR